MKKQAAKAKVESKDVVRQKGQVRVTAASLNVGPTHLTQTCKITQLIKLYKRLQYLKEAEDEVRGWSTQTLRPHWSFRVKCIRVCVGAYVTHVQAARGRGAGRL